MSASTLLIDGKINPSLIPASAIPTNPVFQSVEIDPPAGVAGQLNILNPAGASFNIIKGLDGITRMFQTPVGQPPNAVMLASADGNYVGIWAQTIELGDQFDSTPSVLILGSTGTGQVYDTRYNPVNKEPEVAGTGTISITGGANNIAVPITRTGLYQFVLTLEVGTSSVVGAGCIVIDTTEGLTGPAVPSLCHTITPSVLTDFASSGGAVAPIRFTFTFLGYLTEGIEYDMEIVPIGSDWEAIDFTVTVGQMC